MNWWIHVTVTPSFLFPGVIILDVDNDFLLVVSIQSAGARILVSGVEEIDTSPEDPIVHLSPPYHGVGSRGAIPC